MATPTVRGSTSPFHSAARQRDQHCRGHQQSAAPSRRGIPRMRGYAHREHAALATHPTTISNPIGHTGDREDAFDAGELGRRPRADEIRPRAERRREHEGDAEQREQGAPGARGDGPVALERADEHLDAHEPAVQRRVRELQEYGGHERQRHHLRDARDRVVEQGSRRDVGADQERQREHPHDAGGVERLDECGESLRGARVRLHAWTTRRGQFGRSQSRNGMAPRARSALM
jgi:hypothetical protein